MTITWFARLLPYFIVEKVFMRTTSDNATLSFTNDHQYAVNVWEIDAGVWIVKSSKVELLRARKKLESQMGAIDERLECLGGAK